ncbi:FGGY-family carbohydrate kinase [Lederbergia ruris]|uniref:FGGY-family carbohydrate kinase n=1 Tax=Lederbergia ruris TaxID=217495 RepID=UPI0039A1F959
MRLLGIDIGTTHIKVGLFRYDGTLVKLAIRKNQSYTNKQGHSFYRPDELWKVVMQATKEVTAQQEKIISIGITSMAESGLLLIPETGECRSNIIPWFDRRTESIANFIQQEIDPISHFIKTGLRNNYKHGLAKILWLQQEDSDQLRNARWLSTSDFIAYKLTGIVGTDYTLAARTFAFRIDKKEWDIPLISHFGINPSIFPEARPSGKKLGEIVTSELKEIGLQKGIPVAVSGHDHVCAAFAVGAVKTGVVSDSVGTAETLVGAFNHRELTKQDYNSGFNFGRHISSEKLFWMGAIQSSGGSVEWLRNKLSSESLSYQDINTLLDATPKKPTGILYYPYLAGSGSPQADPKAKGAFIGIQANHDKGILLRGLLEGTAYEFEYMRRAIEEVQNFHISKLVAVGGGTKNLHWMQIKADISGCPISIPAIKEATLLGAAIAAGLGCGIYNDEDELFQLINQNDQVMIRPNQDNYQIYRRLFEQGYMPLQQPLRAFYKKSLQ